MWYKMGYIVTFNSFEGITNVALLVPPMVHRYSRVTKYALVRNVSSHPHRDECVIYIHERYLENTHFDILYVLLADYMLKGQKTIHV